MTLFDVVRFGGPAPWDPEDDEPLTLEFVNFRLLRDGLRLIRVEDPIGSQPSDYQRQAYVLTRLNGREIDPPRIYGMLAEVARTFFHI